MQEDSIIQQNLFSVNDESNPKKISKEIVDDLSEKELKKQSQERPRERKSSVNLINQFKTELISESKNDFINEKSYSYKTVAKSKLTPVMRHYVSLKEENKDRLLLYRLGDFFECFFEDAVLISNLLEITLTSKEAGKEIGKIPMAGVPHHALERYCTELIKKKLLCSDL